MSIVMMETLNASLGFLPPGALIIGDPTAGPACFHLGGPRWKEKYPGPLAVRRPTMGLELKQERQAWFQVVGRDGEVIPLYNSVGGYNPPAQGQDAFPGGETKSRAKSDHYTDFMLTTVQEERAEKFQIVETFGEGYFLPSGERPRILAGSGYLVNGKDFMWRAQFWENYNRYLRGTRCAEGKAKVFLAWDDNIVEGYLIGANASEGADNRELIHFSFSMLLVDHLSLAALRFNDVAGLDRVSVATAAEMVKRGELDVYSGPTIAATSRGMRTRNRLAGMGMVGRFLAVGGLEMLTDLINSPADFLARVGSDFLGKILDVGNELIYEQMAAAFGPDIPLGDKACFPQALTGKTLMKEWWQDARGWLWSLFDAVNKLDSEMLGAPGLGVPFWAYQLLESPLAFFKVFMNHGCLMGADTEKGKKVKGVMLMTFGVIGLSLFSAKLAMGGGSSEVGGNSVASLPPTVTGITSFFPLV